MPYFFNLETCPQVIIDNFVNNTILLAGNGKFIDKLPLDPSPTTWVSQLLIDKIRYFQQGNSKRILTRNEKINDETPLQLVPRYPAAQILESELE